MFESIPFWAGSIYVCFPLGLLLYGWNDIGDAESDRLNPRKDSWLFGARPDEKMRLRLPWLMAAIQMPFVIAFCILAGPKMLGWFLAVLATNAAYNQLAFKQIVVLDLINQVGPAGQHSGRAAVFGRQLNRGGEGCRGFVLKVAHRRCLSKMTDGEANGALQPVEKQCGATLRVASGVKSSRFHQGNHDAERRATLFNRLLARSRDRRLFWLCRMALRGTGPPAR